MRLFILSGIIKWLVGFENTLDFNIDNIDNSYVINNKLLSIQYIHIL